MLRAAALNVNTPQYFFPSGICAVAHLSAGTGVDVGAGSPDAKIDVNRY
jgi:hypothetical protein